MDSQTAHASSGGGGAGDQQQPKVVQPKPQALPQRSGPASILVSTRQKGNPLLQHIRNLPWEYSDIIPDYVVGATTCALFLSLKYHRIHPEYIYTRIKALAYKFNLRILLTMVDIQNHEDSLKELSKTSLINNVTIILCWSAQEAGRYIELFKSYENASPTAIRAHQSTTYADKMVEFITTPRSINKTDALGLVSSFGSIRTAINARPEEVALVSGWGDKKVKRWCGTVREPFRNVKALKRGVTRNGDDDREEASGFERQDPEAPLTEEERDPALATRLGIASRAIGTATSRASPPPVPVANDADQSLNGAGGPDEDEELAMMETAGNNKKSDQFTNGKESGSKSSSISRAPDLNTGVAAALAKLRQGG